MDVIKKLTAISASLLVCWLWFAPQASAQTTLEIKKADRLFSGFWVNKKTKRHLSIGVEESEYMLINDWTGNTQETAIVDAYKAFVKGNKLVMPPNSEHHTPYSEMQIINKKLFYITKLKDIEGKSIVEKEVFTRLSR